MYQLQIHCYTYMKCCWFSYLINKMLLLWTAAYQIQLLLLLADAAATWSWYLHISCCYELFHQVPSAYILDKTICGNFSIRRSFCFKSAHTYIWSQCHKDLICTRCFSLFNLLLFFICCNWYSIYLITKLLHINVISCTSCIMICQNFYFLLFLIFRISPCYLQLLHAHHLDVCVWRLHKYN